MQQRVDGVLKPFQGHLKIARITSYELATDSLYHITLFQNLNFLSKKSTLGKTFLIELKFDFLNQFDRINEKILNFLRE